MRRGGLEVALVHRPGYDDWSWAKGKLDPREEWPVAAVRETFEETGLVVRLGRPLPDSRYAVLGRGRELAEKVVRYWAAEVTGGHGRTEHEIDEVAWLDVQRAHQRLDYSRDRDQLLAVVRAHQLGSLSTWPLILVRHAKALPRSKWRKDDRARPLDRVGTARTKALVPLLTAYRVSRLVSSPSARCMDTFGPYAAASGVSVSRRPSLSEEVYEQDPERAVGQVEKAFEKAVSTAVCTHGPVVPAILDLLERRLDPGDRDAPGMVEAFEAAREDRLVKGEAMVCHVVGTGPAARVVAVERHLP